MANLNFFDVYTLIAITEEIVPKQTFFKDRYFKTSAGDIFNSDKVLTEYRDGDRKMAAFVSSRAGDLPVERRGYAIHEYEPAYIAPSRPLTTDDLAKRGFGEALYASLDKQKRAAMIIKQDLVDLDNRITRREEWMAVQTMINNACTMQTYIDAATQGETLYVQFYDTTSDHTYTVSTKWDASGGDIRGDVRAMSRMLSSRGLPVADLIVGVDAADVIYGSSELRELLDTHSGIAFGGIDESLTKYDGVTFMGVLNFGGYKLNVICADETYKADDGTTTNYFPAKAAMVTAPDCGHMMYGKVTQIDFGSSEFTDHAGSRIPKLTVDQEKDIRKMVLKSRPLAAPKNYCPYIYAANVVN